MSLAVLNVLASAQRRGAETFAYELHRVLLDRGVQSSAVSLIPAADGGLPVASLGARRYSPMVLRDLRRRAATADIVIGHGSSTLLACGISTLSLGVPFIYVNIGDPGHWATTRARRLRVRLLLQRAAAVAAISPRSKDALVSGYGLKPERVWVIPNGRSAERFRPATELERTAARERLGIRVNEPVLALIGALREEKRVDTAIAALADLPKTTLVVAGDGPDRAALESLAAAVAPGQVLFLGAVANVADLLAAADAVVLSSESEGVPGSLIEAGLAGLPAVATDVGFVRDVIKPGTTGELVPSGRPREFASAVKRVLADRHGYGANARAHCLAQFEIQTIADRWEDLLRTVRAAHDRQQLLRTPDAHPWSG